MPAGNTTFPRCIYDHLLLSAQQLDLRDGRGPHQGVVLSVWGTAAIYQPHQSVTW